MENILMHHVASGKLSFSDIASGELKSIEGSVIKSSVEGADVCGPGG